MEANRLLDGIGKPEAILQVGKIPGGPFKWKTGTQRGYTGEKVRGRHPGAAVGLRGSTKNLFRSASNSMTLCTRHCSKHIMCVNSLTFTLTLRVWYYVCVHFKLEGTEAQKGCRAWP